MKEQKLQIPRGKIVGVQFSVISTAMMKSFHPIDTRYEGMQEQYKELESPSLGSVFQEDKECETCKGTAAVRHGESPCPGHMGVIELDQSQHIFHPLLMDKLAEIMSLFCPTCKKLKYRTLLEAQGVCDPEAQNQQLSRLRSFSPMYKFICYLREMTESVKCCNTLTRFKPDESQNLINEITGSKSAGIDDKTSQQVKALKPQDVEKIVRQYKPEDLQLLGLENAHPINMIMQAIPVAPMSCRPNVTTMGMVSRDQMTDQYRNLLRAVTKKQDNDQMDFEKQRRDIATCFRGIMKSSGAEDQESVEQKFKGIAERLKGKPGRMRMNVQGKRVNFCSRSVISGDPTISIDQLGVPRSVATRLSFPEPVTERNKEFLESLVKNGVQYPGANAIERQGGEVQRLETTGIDQVHVNIGDIVHRHLLDDDVVMFNRQPSLHKMSFMAHRVKVLPYSTFRLNLCCTRPYNADFDGDEMNMHEPQSYQAIAEMQEIMLVPKQIISCKNNAPLISIVQDSLIGCFVVTQRDYFIDRQSFQKYMMFIEYPDDSYKPGFGAAYELKESERQNSYQTMVHSLTMSGTSFTSENEPGKALKETRGPMVCAKTPQPAVLFPQPLWTGKQLFSLSIPNKMNLIVAKDDPGALAADKVINIQNGQLLTGVANSKLVGQAQGGLIHVLWKDFSSDICKAFLNNCQRTFTQIMIDNSFSVGLGDMVIDPKSQLGAQQLNQALLQQNYKDFQASIENKIKLAPGQTNEQGFEGQFQKALQTNAESLVGVVRGVLPKRNALICMADSGAKGKDLNIMQIAACVGQQLLQGSRMQYRFLTYRSLPHFQPFDYSMHSRGYVFHSFIYGLDVAEFWFHMTGGREGVCDTSIKTADSGYVERKMMKNLESVSQGYDNSVRNDQNCFIQLRYGDDNLNTHMCEAQEYPAIGFTDETFREAYYVNYDAQQLGGRRRGGEQQAQASFAELTQYFDSVERRGMADFQLTHPDTQSFQVVVDADIIPQDELLKYLHVHIENFISNGQRTESTPPLNQWLTDTAVGEASRNATLMKMEYLVLLAERFWLQSVHMYCLQLNRAKSVEFMKNTSCDLRRVFNNAMFQHIKQKTPLLISDHVEDTRYCDAATTDLDPATVVREVNALLKRLNDVRSNESKIFRCLVRQVFSSRQVCFVARLSRDEFHKVLLIIEDKFLTSSGVPGEPVGPLGSHSISEPATQLTLNTFHTAGTSALGSLGLPRLKELIDFRSTKTPIMTIYTADGIKHGYIDQFSKAKKRAQLQSKALMRVAAQIENSYFRDFVKAQQIIFDPQDNYGPDQLWFSFRKPLKRQLTAQNPFVLRYELSLAKLVEKEEILSVRNIVEKIRCALQDINKQTKEYTYDVDFYCGLGPQVIRIRPLFQEARPENLLQLSQQLQEIHICGLPAIAKVFQDGVTDFIHFGHDKFTPEDPHNSNFGGIYKSKLSVESTPAPGQKSEKEPMFKELIIRTEGSDLLTVLGMSGVDTERTIVNDLPEVYDVLGVEAARQLLVSEMRNTLPSDGLNVRHFAVLADVMMASPSHGKMISINRHGMRVTNTGVIAQASFEQPADAFLGAAAYGLYDNAETVSTAVTLGMEMRHGTSSFDLLLDVHRLPDLPDTVHPDRRVEIKKQLQKELEAQQSSQAGMMSAMLSGQDNVFNFTSARVSGRSYSNISASGVRSRSVMSNISEQQSQASQLSINRSRASRSGRTLISNSRFSTHSISNMPSRSRSCLSQSKDIDAMDHDEQQGGQEQQPQDADNGDWF